jgi:hypothetical protein
LLAYEREVPRHNIPAIKARMSRAPRELKNRNDETGIDMAQQIQVSRYR